MKKFSVRTKYKNIIFRSKLESLWAEFFDFHQIRWVYEKDTGNPYFVRKGVWYLPDFYLPDQNMYFECKGVMDKIDREKINSLAIQTKRPVLVGYYPEGKKLHIVRPVGRITKWTRVGNQLVTCDLCDKLFFSSEKVICEDCDSRSYTVEVTFISKRRKKYEGQNR